MRPGDGGVASAVTKINVLPPFFQGRATALQNSCARPCHAQPMELWEHRITAYGTLGTQDHSPWNSGNTGLVDLSVSPSIVRDLHNGVHSWTPLGKAMF